MDESKFSPAFPHALARFDAENALDPKSISMDGVAEPYELFYARALSEWVVRLCPAPSEELLLAARSQHICRWMSPRESYPEGRTGYLKWRADLKEFHAKKSAEVLADCGYSPAVIQRVRSLNLKENLGGDPEAQVLEDALCLVTLQFQISDLAAKTDPQKMIHILGRTWKKMSGQAREEAGKLTYSDAVAVLINQAVAATRAAGGPAK